MEFRGIMGGFYRISEWIMRLTVTNILWLLFSSPFVFLIVTFLFVPPDGQTDVNVTWDLFMQWVIILGVVAPFTVIPATTAVFTSARKWVMGEVDVPLWKTFFRGYKENYLQSMLGGIFFVILSFVMLYDYMFFKDQEGNMKILAYLFITLGVLTMAAFFNFFSIMVHFHMKLLQVIKNSFLITIGHPISTISMLVINAFMLYIATQIQQLTFLLPFFISSLFALSTFWHFYRNFERMQAKMEKAEEEKRLKEEEEAEAAALNSQSDGNSDVETIR